MSAFICSDKIINLITTEVSMKIHGIDGSYLRRRMFDYGYSYVDANTFAQDIYNLNVEAVDQRYSEKNDRQTFNFYTELAPDQVYYKALKCWLYQCSEGDVPDTPLFKFMDEVFKLYFADRIIEKMQGYDDAPWG